jgi:2'-5' RNA ligase
VRAFIAIDISSDLMSRLEDLIENEKKRLPRARWVRPTNLHLTLRFLGETSSSVLDEISKSLEATAARYPPLALDYRGVGFFPSSSRPRVLWVGIPNPPAELSLMQKDIEIVAQQLGFEPEKRRFSPHLTLARFREPRSDRRFTELAKELEDHRFGTSRVHDVVLYQSVLRPQGAQYQVLRKFPLSGAR